jgi:hypothetical protein
MTARLLRPRWRAFTPLLAIPATVGLAAALTLANPDGAQAQEAPVGLGTAADFSVLAGSTVTNTGDTTLEQSLGVSPGSAAPGFPPGEVEGETHLADEVADQAKLDLTAAYNDAAGRTPFTNLAAELGGTTLTAGVYRISAAQLTGQLTLDLEEDPEGVSSSRSTPLSSPSRTAASSSSTAPRRATSTGRSAVRRRSGPAPTSWGTSWPPHRSPWPPARPWKAAPSHRPPR